MGVIPSTTGAATTATAIDSGVAALDAATRRLDRDAAQVATRGGEAMHALVDTGQARLQAQAAVSVIRTSNAVLGTLLDLRA
jgi:hypothetical protein